MCYVRKEFCKLNKVSCMQCKNAYMQVIAQNFWRPFVNIIFLLNEFQSLVCFPKCHSNFEYGKNSVSAQECSSIQYMSVMKSNTALFLGTLV